MDFSEKITEFSKRIEIIKDNLLTEEATKTSIILPFFQILHIASPFLSSEST